MISYNNNKNDPYQRWLPIASIERPYGFGWLWDREWRQQTEGNHPAPFQSVPLWEVVWPIDGDLHWSGDLEGPKTKLVSLAYTGSIINNIQHDLQKETLANLAVTASPHGLNNHNESLIAGQICKGLVKLVTDCFVFLFLCQQFIWKWNDVMLGYSSPLTYI